VGRSLHRNSEANKQPAIMKVRQSASRGGIGLVHFPWLVFVLVACFWWDVALAREDEEEQQGLEGEESESSWCLQLVENRPAEWKPDEYGFRMPCFKTPVVASSSIAGYRVRIQVDACGKYLVEDFPRQENPFVWTALAVEYCSPGQGTVIQAPEFVTGSTWIVTAVPYYGAGEEGTASVPPSCVSHPVSYGYGGNGGAVQETPDGGLGSGSVFWFSPRYALRADTFEYRVAGEASPVSMSRDALNVEVNGDPGGKEYMTIEIYWEGDGLEKRFYGYFESDGHSIWNMFEARVYNHAEEWETFDGLTIVSGNLGECFKRDRLVLNNGNDGSEVVFGNLSLATFLPWSDDSPSYLECLGLPADAAFLDDVAPCLQQGGNEQQTEEYSVDDDTIVYGDHQKGDDNVGDDDTEFAEEDIVIEDNYAEDNRKRE